jgi:hypothetical protein
MQKNGVVMTSSEVGIMIVMAKMVIHHIHHRQSAQ